MHKWKHKQGDWQPKKYCIFTLNLLCWIVEPCRSCFIFCFTFYKTIIKTNLVDCRTLKHHYHTYIWFSDPFLLLLDSEAVHCTAVWSYFCRLYILPQETLQTPNVSQGNLCFSNSVCLHLDLHVLRNVSPTSYEIILKSSWEIETNCGLIRSLFSFVNSFEKLLGQTKLLLYIFCQTRNVFCFETMLKEY